MALRQIWFDLLVCKKLQAWHEPTLRSGIGLLGTGTGDAIVTNQAASFEEVSYPEQSLSHRPRGSM